MSDLLDEDSSDLGDEEHYHDELGYGEDWVFVDFGYLTEEDVVSKDARHYE